MAARLVHGGARRRRGRVREAADRHARVPRRRPRPSEDFLAWGWRIAFWRCCSPGGACTGRGPRGRRFDRLRPSRCPRSGNLQRRGPRRADAVRSAARPSPRLWYPPTVHSAPVGRPALRVVSAPRARVAADGQVKCKCLRIGVLQEGFEVPGPRAARTLRRGSAGACRRGHIGGAAELESLISSGFVHVGPSGDGQALKVVNNAIMGVCMVTSCEAAVLSQKLGLDPQVLFDVVTRSSGDNWVFRNWFPLPDVVPTSPSSHGYEPGFMVDLVHKDLKLAEATAGEFDLSMETVATAAKLFARASTAGAGERDPTALALELGAEVD
ncbi:NAD(P)-dependent oxidoreductase [Pseudonocardia halophobica]|uniref:NAD(P)-dependent oxidoreductase n=1 Tax=Pseudonocardia halophobica TaxID=29401 RepID=UPI003D8CCE47